MAALNGLPRHLEPLDVALDSIEDGNLLTFSFVKSRLLQKEQQTLFCGTMI